MQRTVGESLTDYYQVPSEDLFDKAHAFAGYLGEIRSRGHDLYRRTLYTASDHRVQVFDEFTGQVREMVMMASNNYLGLTYHPKVVEAAVRATQEYGAGAGSVPLLAGTMRIHRQLEERLAQFKGCEDAMVFAAGFSSNLGCLAGLLRPGDLAVNDILNHASILDGCKMAGAVIKTYPHQDLRSLERILARAEGQGKLVVVDGVFSMDGDIAPLPDLIRICRQYGARLMIDEAHATGVIGEHGRGTPEYWGVEGKVDIVAGTLSKALGGVGGFVASTREVIDYLRIFARSYMFSTALPP
ncbi:MAG TPA: pyridoxal phosphate-dependent aminotransferase family protein, partial [Firmicutes bacterium]|nr:pyridoxal phosphate-dependent aminotransferase family protein [Bacillota bacterium]